MVAPSNRSYVVLLESQVTEAYQECPDLQLLEYNIVIDPFGKTKLVECIVPARSKITMDNPGGLQLSPVTALVDVGIAHTVTDVTYGEFFSPEKHEGRQLHVRFTVAGMQRLTRTDPNSFSVPLTDLKKSLAASGSANYRLFQLQKWVEGRWNELNPLPWNQQIRSGKIYRTRQLVMSA